MVAEVGNVIVLFEGVSINRLIPFQASDFTSNTGLLVEHSPL